MGYHTFHHHHPPVARLTTRGPARASERPVLSVPAHGRRKLALAFLFPSGNLVCVPHPSRFKRLINSLLAHTDTCTTYRIDRNILAAYKPLDKDASNVGEGGQTSINLSVDSHFLFRALIYHFRCSALFHGRRLCWPHRMDINASQLQLINEESARCAPSASSPTPGPCLPLLLKHTIHSREPCDSESRNRFLARLNSKQKTPRQQQFVSNEI
jgi:hypothetical protein